MPEATKPSIIGRPPVSEGVIGDVFAMLDQEKEVAEIIETTKLSQTKVYELRRLWRREKSRSGDSVNTDASA